MQETFSFSTWFDRFKVQPLDTLYPINRASPTDNYVGGFPSVILTREVIESGDMKKHLKERMLDCKTSQDC